MKKALNIIIALLCTHLAQANTTNDSIQKSKQCFSDAYSQIQQMLEGTKPLNYEKAIFLTENAFYENAINYEDYKAVLDFHTQNIKNIAEANRNNENIKQNKDPLLSKQEKLELYNNVLYNWAIYTYLTDTTFFMDTTGIYFHLPYSYSKNDPYGKQIFSNTQTISLLLPQLRTGNCYAMATLFKLFAERLTTQAQLATAPGHIYIRHQDINGTWYNVEPATGSFPGTGTISTVTYTTDKAIETGIALRTLNQEQSINLCMIYLAKGYENKFNEAHSPFALQCAETALQYDTKNLNALLLKAEILESKLLATNKSIAQLQNSATFKEYEQLITQLHGLGYKQMPDAMRNYITATIKGDSAVLPPTINQQAKGYASLSKGILVEDIKQTKIEQYNHTLYNTKTNKITGFTQTTQEDVDVVFALSVDPLTAHFPWYTPYQYAGNDVVRSIDIDGLEPKEIITSVGKISAPVLAFITAAFPEWNTQKLSETPFIRMSKGEKDKNWATTYIDGLGGYYVTTNSDKSGFDFWLNTVVHEGKHIQDMESDGIGYFLNYAYDYITKGYIDTEYEVEARKTGAPVEKFSYYNDIEGVLTSDRSDEWKIKKMQYLGVTYRIDRFNQELSNLSNKKSNLLKQYEAIKTGSGGGATEAATMFYNRYITPVELEINKVTNKINEAKKDEKIAKDEFEKVDK